MSDPVTNVDVEDVLSSIRRLVSNTEEKLHPAPKPDRAEAPLDPEDSATETSEATETPAADALVLTSALRVSDPATEPDEAEDLDPSEGSAVLDNLRSALSQDHSEAAEYEEEDSLEDVPTDAVAEDDVTDTAETLEAVEEAIAFQELDAGPEDESALEDDARWSVEDTQDDSEEHVAEVMEEAAEAEDHQPMEDERAEQDLSEPAPEPESAEEEQVNWHEDAPEESADDAWAHVEPAPEPVPEPDHEEPEVAEAADPEPEEDAPAQFSSSRTHEAVSEPEIAEDPAAETVFHEEGDEDIAAVDLADFDEAVIDEEMLRDLVAEIVRQELTGTLGERITRNVRKLVRREIHRAMLTRDFD